jgi:hypothetical protein
VTVREHTLEQTNENDPQSRIHPSLRPYLLGIQFDQLTFDEAQRIFEGNAEAIIAEFVREARAKGLME